MDKDYLFGILVLCITIDTETLKKFVLEAIKIKKAKNLCTFLVKLRYSEKATKICNIFHLPNFRDLLITQLKKPSLIGWKKSKINMRIVLLFWEFANRPNSEC